MVALTSIPPLPPSTPSTVEPVVEPPRAQLVGPVRDGRKLAEWSLVLKSLGVEHGISTREDGWYMLVASENLPRVQRAIADYEIENRDWPPRGRARDRLAYEPSASLVVAWSVVLAAVFAASGPVAGLSRWFDAGVAESVRIAHGQVWRAITALTLHADAEHLLGNVIVGGAFLWFASRRLGAGRAAFFTLIAATLGNVANALLHYFQHQPHGSIGASTAVFATVGLLVGTQVRSDAERGVRSFVERMAPWVGGAALLGALGASAKSDLWAHLFGLLGGVLLGLVVARAPIGDTRRSRWIQRVYAGSTVALLVGAWAIAFALRR
jgi:membrane associated rhomboid family serine protease